MKVQSLQKKTIEDLIKMETDSRNKLQQLRFDLATGKVRNVREIRKLRREVARILTLLHQKNK